MKNKLVIIIAPFWNVKSHVGVRRIKRYIKWLSPYYKIIVISAGKEDFIKEHGWGNEIIIRDPLNLYERMEQNKNKSDLVITSYTKFKRWITNWVFNPDYHIIWGKRVLKSNYLKNLNRHVEMIISSSRPESSHVVAEKLSRHMGAKLIIDLRDGWFDDPLKTYLKKKNLRVYLERLIENRVLESASKIFVTSEKWKELLSARKPKISQKIAVLTNGYDPAVETESDNKFRTNGQIILIHAGNFTRSRSTQKLKYLIDPLEEVGSQLQNYTINILLIGNLRASEYLEIENYNKKFRDKNISIIVKDFLPKEKLNKELRKSDGFLLLSASPAAIPSKLFDYLVFRKPILTVTPKESGLWQLTKKIPNVFLVDTITRDFNKKNVFNFLNVCKERKSDYNVPDQFSEVVLRDIFYSNIQDILNKKL